MAVPTLPDPEILEAADDGRLVDLAMYRALLAPVLERNREQAGEGIDAEDIGRIATSLQEVREELVGRTMRVLDENRDRDGASDLHLKVGLLVLDLEEIQRELAGRYGS